MNFKEILGRLIIETKLKESFSEEKHRSLMDEIFKLKERSSPSENLIDV
jgi:hypothetical protein